MKIKVAMFAFVGQACRRFWNVHLIVCTDCQCRQCASASVACALGQCRQCRLCAQWEASVACALGQRLNIMSGASVGFEVSWSSRPEVLTWLQAQAKALGSPDGKIEWYQGWVTHTATGHVMMLSLPPAPPPPPPPSLPPPVCERREHAGSVVGDPCGEGSSASADSISGPAAATVAAAAVCSAGGQGNIPVVSSSQCRRPAPKTRPVAGAVHCEVSNGGSASAASVSRVVIDDDVADGETSIASAKPVKRLWSGAQDWDDEDTWGDWGQKRRGWAWDQKDSNWSYKGW